jgi:outer membrane protein assembly factor BamB
MAFPESRFGPERRRDALQPLRPPLREPKKVIRDAVGYPPLFDDELIVISDMGGLIVALDTAEKVVWTYPLHGPFDPATSPRGMAARTGDTLYVNDDKELVALNARTGATIGTAVVAQTDPLHGVAVDGALITPFLHGGDQYHVGRFEPEMKWSVPTDEPLATLAAGAGVCVYQPESRRVGALDLGAGKEAWNVSIENVLVSTPVIWEGHVYLGIRGGIVQCLELATGKEHWRRRVEINNPSNLTLDPAGRLELCTHPWHLTLDARSGEEVRRHNFEEALRDFHISMVLQMDLSRTHLWAADHFGVVFAMHRQTGRIDWVQSMEGRIPAGHYPVLRDGGLLFLDGGYRLHFFEKDR